jgi:hypothetical protein
MADASEYRPNGQSKQEVAAFAAWNFPAEQREQEPAATAG